MSLQQNKFFNFVPGAIYQVSDDYIGYRAIYVPKDSNDIRFINKQYNRQVIFKQKYSKHQRLLFLKSIEYWDETIRYFFLSANSEFIYFSNPNKNLSVSGDEYSLMPAWQKLKFEEVSL